MHKLFAFILRRVPQRTMATCGIEPMDMNCKVAVITGGTTGIGFQIAQHFLKEKIRNVALIGLSTCAGREAVNALNCAYGLNKAMFVNADIKCPNMMAETFKTIKDIYNRIDILVNAAGICDGQNWTVEIATNLMGTIHTSLAALKYMSKVECGNGGVIINVSGTYGLQPLPASPTLAACQHAIVGMSRSFGALANYDRTGVRVTCLCPGVTHTAFLEGLNKKGLDETMGFALEKEMHRAQKQHADVCGKAAVHLLRKAETGSVWVVDVSKLYELEVPNWRKYAVLCSQYV